MSEIASKPDLMERLVRTAVDQGLEVTKRSDDDLGARREAITAKWLLGRRKLVYRMSLHLDGTAHVVRYRESTMEASWGLPPPTFTFEVETISGKARSGNRRDVSVGGGGAIDYAVVRAAIEQAVRDAGWGFALEIGFAQ